MDTDENSTPPSTKPIDEIISASFPPLDPNGQPLSMILRGDAAELSSLRSALSASPNTRQELQLEIERKMNDDGGKFGDVVMGDQDARNESLEAGNRQVASAVGGNDSINDGTSSSEPFCDGDANETKKRTREEEDTENNAEVNDDDDDEALDIQEQVLLYLPHVKCTCPSWGMGNVTGELLVTSIRVLFMALATDDGTDQSKNDVAIDARCIALHAVDSLPSAGEEGKETNLSHVYCQLSEPNADEGDMGYPSATSMIAHTEILDDDEENVNEEENNQDGYENSEEDGAVEVYFRPINSDEVGKNVNRTPPDNCQELFDALTKLASLNPLEDSDEGGGGGGLFNLMSMMAGMGGVDGSNGFCGDGMEGFVFADDHNNDDDDEMVVRFGGSNNVVENDDESAGAPEEARQAMLERLDGMLTVPPEYEIPSSEEDGQFDDADDDNALL